MEKENNRVITSVSISNEMNQMIKEFKISPTEVFRVGMAVTLAEMGFANYRTPLNESRIQLMKENKDKVMEALEKLNSSLLEFYKLIEGGEK